MMRVLKQKGSIEFLLLCGVIGPLLFVVVLLIEGATRPGYNTWQTPGGFLAFAGGLRRIWRTGRASVWGPLLIGLFGLGLVIAGVFVTDPGGGIHLVLPSIASLR